MNILTICNIWDKVVCNLLTKWVRDLKIGQNTGYLAHVMMAKSNLLNIQIEHPKKLHTTLSEILHIVRMFILYV